MSRTALARRSGVSLPSVNRMLNDGIDRTAVSNVRAVAAALGMEMTIVPTCSSLEWQEKRREPRQRRSSNSSKAHQRWRTRQSMSQPCMT